MVQWIMDNGVAVLAAFAAFIVLAKIIVKMTPNKTDDAVVERIAALEETLEGIFRKDPSKAPTEALPKPASKA